MVAIENAKERFLKLVRGHWLDAIGNSIIVSTPPNSDDHELTAVLTPLIDHPDARDRVLAIRYYLQSKEWRCGKSCLEFFDEQAHRLVWVTQDGRRSVWSRALAPLNSDTNKAGSAAFPWLMNNTDPEPWLPLDLPRDVLYDGARVAALLDIRQMIGARTEPQERLTHILMDHDLHPMKGDYLIPAAESPLWQSLNVPETLRRSIRQRIQRIPHEALSQQISWSGDSDILVGHHKISCRVRDIQALDARWVSVSPSEEQRKPLEIARLLALYSVFDNPLSNRRNGVHLGLDPDLRRQCDYELFASPLNAAVPNGHFASKWPHLEWRFGSIGSYPSVLSFLPVNSVVCVNPPFTEAYLADVMSRLAELKLRFRLRIAIPIQEMPWRKKLHSSLPGSELLHTYYDASSENITELLHPTLLWEDPRCPDRQQPRHCGDEAMAAMIAASHHLPMSCAAMGGGTEMPGMPMHNTIDAAHYSATIDVSAAFLPSTMVVGSSSASAASPQIGQRKLASVLDGGPDVPRVRAPCAQARSIETTKTDTLALDASEWPELSQLKGRRR